MKHFVFCDFFVFCFISLFLCFYESDRTVHSMTYIEVLVHTQFIMYLLISFFVFICLHTHLHNQCIYIDFLVTPFVSMLEKEDESSASISMVSTSESTESTKNSKNMERISSTKTSKSNDDVSTTTEIRKQKTTCKLVIDMSQNRCDRCASTGPNMSEKRNYIGIIKPIVSKCCISDTNTTLLCTEISDEVTEVTFSTSKVEDGKKHLSYPKTKTLYETECVQILDGIPLNSDDIEEEVIEYYDSLINM